MSLTATLLLGKPIRLPDGIKRPPHHIDRPEPLSAKGGKFGNYDKRKTMREANIARVLSAIVEGVDTIHAIAEHLGISKATVLKAVNRLQDRQQIKRTVGRNAGNIRQYYWRAIA